MTKEYNPHFIPVNESKLPRDIIDNVDWNSNFNLRSEQGNANSDALDALINTGLLKVQLAIQASNSDRLNGQPASFYAARNNVLGLNENIANPNSSYLPTAPEQPTNKRYVDKVFDDYTVKYANGVRHLGVYPTLSQLQHAVPKGVAGDAYLVGANNDFVTYVWNPQTASWFLVGPIRGGKGEPGQNGAGVPAGGNIGQVLQKSGASDYAVSWATLDNTGNIQSTTTKRITLSATAPVNPQNGDLWLKF